MADERETATAATPAESATARAERTMTALGERILVERLHHALDVGGIAGHLAFCSTTLPYLQGLVTLLPRLVRDGNHQAAVETVRTLTAGVQEQGLSPDDAWNEATDFYDRLRREITSQLSDGERPLVDALSRLSRTLMEAWRGAAAPEKPDAPPTIVRLNYVDGETGLASRHYFEERCGEEILRAQRLQKGLTLVLLDVDTAALPGAATGERLARNMTAALLAGIRGFDVAARLDGDRFALLLPETTRAGAAAILSRLARDATQPLQFRVGIAVYPKDGETVHALMQHAASVLHQWTAASS